jgi:hypothetical protein
MINKCLYNKIMKKLIVGLILCIALGSVASHVEAKTIRVNGYYKPSTGRYVAPHYRTTPNQTKYDNYSTKGNYNPNTGKRGTVNPIRW